MKLLKDHGFGIVYAKQLKSATQYAGLTPFLVNCIDISVSVQTLLISCTHKLYPRLTVVISISSCNGFTIT